MSSQEPDLPPEVETEGGDVDEIAIDDNESSNSSDWEDSETEGDDVNESTIDDGSDESSIDEKPFPRIKPEMNLQKSLITLMLGHNGRQKLPLDDDAEHSNPAIPQERTRLAKPINESQPSTQPIPIVPNTVHRAAALSPGTTRRNMLLTELTESLRRHLVRERSQMSLTANAVRRRYRSRNVANLEHSEEVKQRDHFTDNGYHVNGW